MATTIRPAGDATGLSICRPPDSVNEFASSPDYKQLDHDKTYLTRTTRDSHATEALDNLIENLCLPAIEGFTASGAGGSNGRGIPE